LDSQVVRRSTEHDTFQPLAVLVEVIGGVLVKAAPMDFDRFPHWLRMGGEEEARHVDAIARQVELGADRAPVIEPRRSTQIS
jgi:hypothetical protein